LQCPDSDMTKLAVLMNHSVQTQQKYYLRQQIETDSESFNRRIAQCVLSNDEPLHTEVVQTPSLPENKPWELKSNPLFQIVKHSYSNQRKRARSL